jgi:hypothetical protein
MVLLIYRLRRTSKSTRFDKKYLIFGEKDEEGEERHLLGIIIQRHWQYRAQDTEQRQTKQKDTTKK